MSFELRGHTADVAVEATGDDLGELFAAVGDGLAACMIDWPPPAGGDRFRISVDAENVEALLFDFLDRLIVERDVRNVLPVDLEASVEAADTYSVTASARGVPLDTVDAREIKAVTYSEMAIEQVEGGWRAYVVFDV